MSGNKVHDVASETSAEAGVVLVDGPDGVALSMTPSAAGTTAKRLQQSAEKATKQKAGQSPPVE